MRAFGLSSHPRLWLAALLLAVAAMCAPKLGNAFVWDDIGLIVESDRLFHLDNLRRVFAVDAMFVADGGKFQEQPGLDTYRPITIGTFFLDAALSGRNPLGYHLDNLFAHLLCVALVYAWSLRLLGRERTAAAWVAAAFFGMHPLLAEAHVWINGRSDVYCTLFALAGALLSLQNGARTRVVGSIASGLLFLLALLSKETAAPFIVVLLVWRLAGSVQPFEQRRNLAGILPGVLALVGYIALRVHALSGLRAHDGARQLSLALERLPLLLVDALTSMLLPVRTMPRYLHEEYGRLPVAAVWLSAATLLLLAALVFRARARLPVLAFGLVNFVACVAPASLIATLAWYGFGRYLYLPIAVLAPGLVEAGAVGLSWLERRRGERPGRLVRAAVGVYVALFALRLVSSVRSWNGPEAFYTSIIAESPSASHGHGGLGKWLIERGQLDAGIQELQVAVRLSPFDSRYLNNLGVGYLRRGQSARAREIALLGLSRFPKQDKFARLLALAGQPSGSTRAGGIP